MEPKGLQRLIIHIDVANITPELHSAEDLNTYFSALDALCRIIIAGRQVHPVKYVYFEGSFINPEPSFQQNLVPGKLPALLLRFKRVFDSLPNCDKYRQTLPYVILDMFRLRGYEVHVAPKEAEQMIPDEIMKSHKDSIHAVVSDDKARDTTRCKIRVVHSRRRADTVCNRGIADEVYCLEELAERNYLICWLYRKLMFTDPKDCLSLKSISSVSKDHSFSGVDLSADFENFTTNDLRRLVLSLINSDEERISKFLNVGDSYDRLGKFLETVISRLSSEQHLLMHLWGKFRLHREIEKIMSINELDSYFMKYFHSEEIDYIKLEHELEYKEINLRQILRIKGTAEEIKARIREIQNRIDEIYSLEAKLNEKRSELEREEKRERELNENLNQVEQKLRRLQEENQNKVKKIMQMRSEINRIKEEIKKSESLINELEDKRNRDKKTLEKLEENIKNLTEEIKDLERQLSDKRRTHDQLKGERKRFKEEIAQYEREIEEIEKFLRKSQDTIQTLKEKIERLNQEKSLKKKEIEEKERQIRERESELERLKSEYGHLLSKEEEIREEYRKIQKIDELKALYEKVEAFKRSVGEYERVMNIDERFDNVRKELEKLKGRLIEILKESI